MFADPQHRCGQNQVVHKGRMSEKTKIQWCDHSWSPWWGCTPVSPGCANCYASALAKRFRGFEYRKGGPRQLTKDWDAPRLWNRAAAKAVLIPACSRQ